MRSAASASSRAGITRQDAIDAVAYRLVMHTKANGFGRRDFATREELIGYLGTPAGLSPSGGPTRPQLWNQPTFVKLCGPMWDGDAVRYENTEANEILSR